jgi:hypothetical protein
MKSFIVLTILFVSALGAAENCWKNAKGRGAGKVLHACAKGFKNENSLCYKPCPAGSKGIAHLCWKGAKNTNRGMGKILGCGPKEENDHSICRNPCGPNFKGIGPVCWGTCAIGMHDCGPACTPDAAACTKFNKENIERAFGLISKIAENATGSIDVKGALEKTKDVAVGFAVSKCSVRLPPHRGGNIFQKFLCARVEKLRIPIKDE